MSGKFGSDMSGINIDRRGLLVGAGKLAVATMALSLPWVRRASAAEDTIKIGCVVPLSGFRASFGASTDHTIEAINAGLANGIEINGKTYAVEIIVKDNQSNPTRSLQVGNELILNDQPDIILVSDAEGGTAIANIADARGIPQISTGGPWQGWAFQRNTIRKRAFPLPTTSSGAPTSSAPPMPRCGRRCRPTRRSARSMPTMMAAAR
jgi:branched-chain amino acid transport system substrate-binding protein